jgi:hypothetical protein
LRQIPAGVQRRWDRPKHSDKIFIQIYHGRLTDSERGAAGGGSGSDQIFNRGGHFFPGAGDDPRLSVRQLYRGSGGGGDAGGLCQRSDQPLLCQGDLFWRRQKISEPLVVRQLFAFRLTEFQSKSQFFRTVAGGLCAGEDAGSLCCQNSPVFFVLYAVKEHISDVIHGISSNIRY